MWILFLDEDSSTTQQYYVTLECANRVLSACPELVTEFVEHKAAAKANRKQTVKPRKRPKAEIKNDSKKPGCLSGWTDCRF